MPNWNKPKPVDWGELPSSISSFNVMPIRDAEFSPETNILCVYNHADRARRVDPESAFNNVAEGRKSGKPAGYGMPGGGVNPEWLEKSSGAAIREGTNESGVEIIRVRHIDIPGEINKFLVLDKKTGDLIRWIPYETGKQKKIELRPTEKGVLNPMYYYLAEADWINSKPREFLLEYRDEMIAEGYCTLEGIAKFGIGINSLTREKLLTLGLDDEEVGKVGDPIEKCEIGGFALAPLSRLRSMWENKWFFLDPDENVDEYYKNGKVGPTSYMYRSHVERILQVVEIAGIV